MALAVAQQLQQELGLYPLLYFATGTLYLGPKIAEFDRAASIQGVIDNILAALTEFGDSIMKVKNLGSLGFRMGGPHIGALQLGESAITLEVEVKALE